MEWQIIIGSIFVFMTLALGILMGWLTYQEFIAERSVPIFLWFCLSIIGLGIVSIVCILIKNIY